MLSVNKFQMRTHRHLGRIFVFKKKGGTLANSLVNILSTRETLSIFKRDYLVVYFANRLLYKSNVHELGETKLPVDPQLVKMQHFRTYMKCLEQQQQHSQITQIFIEIFASLSFLILLSIAVG